MRLSVTAIRVIIVFLNTSLAIAFGAHYGYKQWLHEAKVPALDPRDPTDFRFVPVPLPPVGTIEREMKTAASWLQPRTLPPKPPPLPDTTSEPPKPEEVVGEDELPDGPLAEKWEYVWAMINHADPVKSLIRLQKKTDNPTTTRTSRYSRTSRLRSRSIRSSRSASKKEFVQFYLGDRWFEDSEHEIEMFHPHDVTENEFVYWVPGQRGRGNGPKLYSLKRKLESHYREKKGEVLEPREDDSEDGEEEEKPKIVYGDPEVFERRDGKEEKYQLYLKGKDAGRDPDVTRSRSSAYSTGKKPSVRRVPGSSSSRRTPSSVKPSTSRTSSTKNVKKLGETISQIKKNKNLSSKDRKGIQQVEELLKGKKK